VTHSFLRWKEEGLFLGGVQGTDWYVLVLPVREKEKKKKSHLGEAQRHEENFSIFLTLWGKGSLTFANKTMGKGNTDRAASPTEKRGKGKRVREPMFQLDILRIKKKGGWRRCSAREEGKEGKKRASFCRAKSTKGKGKSTSGERGGKVLSLSFSGFLSDRYRSRGGTRAFLSYRLKEGEKGFEGRGGGGRGGGGI